MHELEGKRIIGIRKSPDATVLSFDTTDGAVCYRAEGDCCSESWFNHMTGVGFLLGRMVTRVEALPEETADGTRQEEDTVYGWHIHTPEGTTSIEMRNSSNGYYGGWAEVDRNADQDATQPLTEDF